MSDCYDRVVGGDLDSGLVLLRMAGNDAIWTLVGVVTERKMRVMCEKELGGCLMARDGDDRAREL